MAKRPPATDVYLALQEDGMAMRESGSWVAEKLFYLERYLDMFTQAMFDKPWRALNYIDLFAGPGKCRVREGGAIHLGSPLLALTSSRPFTGFFFVDRDADTIQVLEKRSSGSPLADRVRYYVGDSNVQVHEIVEYIKRVDDEYRPGVWPSLNLAFLDPDGLELHWDTVVALADMRTDLIIHYSQMGVTREAPNCIPEADTTSVDHYFGGREWRGVYQEDPGSPGRLVEYYVNRLRQLGYVEVKRNDELWRAPLIRSSRKRAPLYRLLFASKSPLGEKFWREATSKDVYGQKRLF